MSVQPRTDEVNIDLTAPGETAPPSTGVGVLAGYMRDYATRVRGGETGSIPAVLGLLVLVIFFAIVHQGFLSAYNVEALIVQAAPIIVMAMGLVFVLLLGEIDLSAGTTGGMCAAIMAILLGRQHFSWPVSVVAGIVTGVVIGFATGWLRAKVGIPSFVITLATFLGFQGITLILIGGQGSIGVRNDVIIALEGLNSKFVPIWAGWALLVVIVVGYAMLKLHDSYARRRDGLPAVPTVATLAKTVAIAVLGAIFVYVMGLDRTLIHNAFFKNAARGMPWSVVMIALLFVGLNFVLGRTRYGRHVYAVGGNEEAARRGGIEVNKVRISVFVICSTLAALSGITAASELESVQSNAGAQNTLLLAVGAAVIGGTSLFGGRGRMIDAILGGLVVAVIQNGMSALISGANSAGWEWIVTGLVLLLAAGFDAVARRVGSTT
ncbi:MAG TPA: ABC transporter permease [Micromonosporaceae bacterium]|nr:ABC transporter permease [Micromonosporaceae bacterium]